MSLFSLYRRTIPFALLITLALSGLSAARADDPKPFLHPLFTDNMVLQRGIPDPVWGWTTPGQVVTVRVAGKGAKATAGADGEWMAKLPPLPVGGPYTLTVSGPQTVTLSDILVGDVWICSGQSNMDYGVGNESGAAAEIAAADHPQIRLFTEGDTLHNEPTSLLSGQWQVCTPQTVAVGHWKGFSAVAYFFGRDLQQVVPVPLGLIQVSWGGTRAETWISADGNRSIPEMRPPLETYQKLVQAEKGGQSFDQIMETWYAKNDPGTAGNWQSATLDDSAWKTVTLPTVWSAAHVPELASFNGTVWLRRTFDLPPAWAGKDLALHFGRVGDRETTYVNGQKVGEGDFLWADRSYPVPSALLKPGRNVIAVRDLGLGDNNGFADPAANMHLEPAGGPAATPLSLAGPWQYQMGAPLPGDDPAPPFVDVDANQPTAVYNSSIAPMIPFGVKGALWYQGESSANVGIGKLYQVQLTTLIHDWRSHWGQGDFPFLIVQLPNTGNPPGQPGDTDYGWAEVREAELLTAERVPNTGLAIAIDTGDGGLHPAEKREIGKRLALAAEALVYGHKTEYSGPIYQSMAVEGKAIRLRFRHLGGGLVAKGGDKLTGFAVAGADGRFVWADAKIDGPTVVVSSPDVPAPTAVRYAWAQFPLCNLYNQAGLPASPFRTDTK